MTTPIWKPLLVIAVLAACAALIYPPQQRLKPGLDLKGGTTLVYQVEVPPDQYGPDVVDQVIATQRRRVDPQGVRNLVFRPLAGNRIEIQMALASPDAVKRRQQYIELRDQLEKQNIQRRELESVLRLAPAERDAKLNAMARGNQARAPQFAQLAAAHDALEQARLPYEESSKALQEAERQIDALPVDAPAQQRQQLEARRQEILGQLLPQARTYNQAEARYDAALQAALAANITSGELDEVLAVPIQLQQKRGAAEAQVTREAAVERLAARHPERAEELREVVQAYNRYEQVKGPLDDPYDLIKLLQGSGVLEFRIAPRPGALSDENQYRQQLAERGPRAGAEKPYRWFLVDDINRFAEKRGEQEELERSPEGFFASRGLIGAEYGGNYYNLLSTSHDATLTQAHPDWRLESARASQDDRGFAAVSFRLNPTGGSYMGQLTGAHKGEPMAILLDNRVISAPVIQSRISDSGIITGGSGGFSRQELSYLLRTLNAGSLAARMGEQPISIKSTGPQLGEDNLRAGLTAVKWAVLAVALFIIGYYMFWGMVATFAMASNVLIVLGVMALFDATFTLPGIAGIVLTIGVAVDANVLIYERIREELERGAALRTAVRLGFGKALSTIMDANITGLITCLILGYTGSAEIKGFAWTFGIGLVANMFTGVFCTRVLIDLFLDIFKPKRLPMLPMFVPAIRNVLSPQIDWLSKRHVFYAISGVIILAGVVAMSYRGKDMLDIEFRSGTQVTFELAGDQMLSIKEVRQRLDQAAEQAVLPELAGHRAAVVTTGQTEGMRAHGFSISTLETDADKVSAAIKSAFTDVLDVQRPVTFSGADEPGLPARHVLPVREPALADVIGRPGLREEVSNYLGGVAILLEEMNPPLPAEELEQRIGRMRLQPAYEAMGVRPFTVIGLDAATGEAIPGAGGEQLRYRSAVVLIRDDRTDYVQNPDAFAEATGLAATEWSLVRDALQRDTSLGSVSNFSSLISATMRQQAINALMLSLVAIIAYVWFRFGNIRYGLGGVAALAHDVMIALSMIAVSGFLAETAFAQALGIRPFRLDLAQIAALLTIVGYSINDTIVIFDRIRENRGRLAEASPAIINKSINQTVSRTILTSTSTLLAVLILYIAGGEGIRGFAFTMMIGIISGTYSTIAVASPILLAGKWKRIREDEAALTGGTPSPAAR